MRSLPVTVLATGHASAPRPAKWIIGHPAYGQAVEMHARTRSSVLRLLKLVPPCCVVIALTGWQNPAVAQVNIEALRPQRSDSGVVGTVGTELSLRTGNVSLVELGVDGRIDWLV